MKPGVSTYSKRHLLTMQKNTFCIAKEYSYSISKNTHSIVHYGILYITYKFITPTLFIF